MPYKILQNPVLSGHNHCHFVCSLRGDFNPLSPCGERHDIKCPRNPIQSISTHSPRVGRDKAVWGKLCSSIVISTHSPRVGRDICGISRADRTPHFNPLSPCGERPCADHFIVLANLFQPTLPVWGETRPAVNRAKQRALFQPTLPVWGETPDPLYKLPSYRISTHSPRVGRDDKGKAD